MGPLNKVKSLIIAGMAILMTTGIMTKSVYAEIRVDISRGNVEPVPTAVSDFYGDGTLSAYGIRIAKVIGNNLDRSGLFRSLDKKSFIQSPQALLGLPRFADWRLIKSQLLVSGSVKRQPDNSILVSVRLWDVVTEKQMLGLEYSAGEDNWRRIAHIVSDDIYERITGEKGYFDTRIVYVSETGPKLKRKKRLAIMDQDGFNHIYITNGADLVLTPRFDPQQQKITYLSYYSGMPQVYLLDIATGQQQLVGNFAGMTFAPRFSPDGQKLIMSHAASGNSEIYEMDITTNQTVRLTTHKGIDTSPSYSPDGKNIVFNSNRGGSSKLYIMSRDGKNVRRLTYGRGLYSTPVWSPRGDLIAFTKQSAGKFHIGVIRPDGTGERLLSESYLDEAPTWSPNGRVIIFFRQEKGEKSRTRLYSVDLTGYNLRELVTPNDASDPTWSPINAR